MYAWMYVCMYGCMYVCTPRIHLDSKNDFWWVT